MKLTDQCALNVWQGCLMCELHPERYKQNFVDPEKVFEIIYNEKRYQKNEGYTLE